MALSVGRRVSRSLCALLTVMLVISTREWQVSAVSAKTDVGCRQEVNCKRPNCVCPSSKPPMHIEPRDLPQLVFFTFDDAVTDFTSRSFNTLFPASRKNPNGCPIPMTLFISHVSTDYKLVRSFYDRGMELAVHSVNHEHIRSTNDMLYEAVQQRKNIATEAGVPIADIKGWRSPFLLPYGNQQMEILKDNGFLYDSTLTIDRLGIEGNTYWPMTLDFSWPYPCMVSPCPKANFTGFWEVPIVSVMDYQKIFPCQYIDGCVQPPPDEDAAFRYLWQNFESYYRNSRAPLGINMHAAWFAWPERLNGMDRFIKELIKLDDVYIVTVQQLIEYVKNPVRLSQIKSFQPFQCKKENFVKSAAGSRSVPESQHNLRYTQPTTRRTTTRRTTTRRTTMRRTTTRRPTTRQPTTRLPTTRRFTTRWITKRPQTWDRTTTTTTPRTTTRRTIAATTRPATTTHRKTPRTSNPRISTTLATTMRPRTSTTTKRRMTSAPRPPAFRSTTAWAYDEWRYRTATPWWNIVDDPVTHMPWWQETRSPTVATPAPWWKRGRNRPEPAGSYFTEGPDPTTKQPSTTRRFRLKLKEIIPESSAESSWTYWTPLPPNEPPKRPTSRFKTTTTRRTTKTVRTTTTKTTTTRSPSKHHMPILNPREGKRPDSAKECLQGVNCMVPFCLCDGIQNPQSIPREKRPQMVYFTFEGPITPQVYMEFVRLFSTRRRNPNGCRIKATFFVPGSGTDPGYTKTLYERGNEISLLAHRGDPIRQRDLLAVRTEIPKVDIKGWRAENLSPLPEGYYDLLPKYGFQYDASMITTRTKSGEQSWPLTLDFGWQRQCNIQPCPTGSHPGVWEVPVIASYDIRGLYPCTYMDGCHMQPQTTNDTYQLLWENFQTFYNTNRAPFAINLRQTWFHYFYLFKLDALNRFIEQLVSMDDVYIVTISEMLEWIKDPVALDELTNFQNWQCF